jgi:hypothetical protein
MLPGKNNRTAVASHRQTLSHNVVSSPPRHELSSNTQSFTQATCDITNRLAIQEK